jgi:hypothetical protein
MMKSGKSYEEELLKIGSEVAATRNESPEGNQETLFRM